jgi:hypothetical protein
MVGEAYDHMMALVVLGAIFIASVVVVPSLSYVNLLYLDQQQLQNIALSAMKTILFDEGYPANWGSMHGLSQFNPSDVKRFGLAALSDPSLYVLDPDKIQRLAFNPMGSMPYLDARNLLGVTGYDFSVVLRPQFDVKADVTIAPNKQSISFSANVSRYGGQPVPNAIVAATIVYALKGGGGDVYGNGAVNMEKRYTDSLGRCSGTQSISAPSGSEITDVAVIFRITVADRMTMVISKQSRPNPDDAAKISIVGDSLVATIDESLPGSMDARWICSISMYNFETSVNLYNRTAPPWGDADLKVGDNMWNMTFPGLSFTEPSILIFTIRTESEDKGGRTIVLLIGPFTLWNQGGVIAMNSGPATSGASVSIERDVIVAGMAYIAELRLWKT